MTDASDAGNVSDNSIAETSEVGVAATVNHFVKIVLDRTAILFQSSWNDAKIVEQWDDAVSSADLTVPLRALGILCADDPSTILQLISQYFMQFEMLAVVHKAATLPLSEQHSARTNCGVLLTAWITELRDSADEKRREAADVLLAYVFSLIFAHASCDLQNVESLGCTGTVLRLSCACALISSTKPLKWSASAAVELRRRTVDNMAYAVRGTLGYDVLRGARCLANIQEYMRDEKDDGRLQSVWDVMRLLNTTTSASVLCPLLNIISPLLEAKTKVSRTAVVRSAMMRALLCWLMQMDIWPNDMDTSAICEHVYEILQRWSVDHDLDLKAQCFMSMAAIISHGPPAFYLKHADELLKRCTRSLHKSRKRKYCLRSLVVLLTGSLPNNSYFNMYRGAPSLNVASHNELVRTMDDAAAITRRLLKIHTPLLEDAIPADAHEIAEDLASLTTAMALISPSFVATRTMPYLLADRHHQPGLRLAALQSLHDILSRFPQQQEYVLLYIVCCVAYLNDVVD